jgi:uncharacterized protein YqgV (UPF0045/DUF77 family)
MQIAVDISLYPLDENFIPPIKDIIDRLGQHEGIEVDRNRMSTQIRGDFDTIMPVLTNEMRTTFNDVPKAVFAIKILNNPIN